MTAIPNIVARENLAATMDQVCEDCNPVIITRGRKPAVVMMSLEDYSALEETACLTSSPANARQLQKSIRQLKRPAQKKYLQKWQKRGKRR